MRRNVPRVMKRVSRLVAEYIPQGDTSMLRLVRMLGWVAAMIIAVFVAGTTSASDSPLTKLATAKFPNLTHAERA